MKRFIAALSVSALLMSCGTGSNPFEDDDDDTGGGDDTTTTDPGAIVIPTGLAGDLGSLIFDPATNTLTVQGITLDDDSLTSVYTRNASLDVPGYQAFTAQDDPLDRHNTALVAESINGGDVRAGVVVSGGPRNRFFGGGFFDRDGDFDAPTTGLVTYAGSYAGLTNLAGQTTDLLAVPGGTPDELIPNQASRVSGDVFLQADFADNAVEGNIFNRSLLDADGAGGPIDLPSIVLISTTIAENGTFEGNVEFDQGAFPADNVTGSSIGTFGGVFGGDDSASVAGIVNLNEFDGPNDPLGIENEEEFGAFVLTQCGQPGDAAICDDVDP